MKLISFQDTFFIALVASQILSSHGESFEDETVVPFIVEDKNIFMNLPNDCTIMESLDGTIKNSVAGIYDNNMQVDVLKASSSSSSKGKLTIPNSYPDGMYRFEATCPGGTIYSYEERNENDVVDERSLDVENYEYLEPAIVAFPFRIYQGSIVDPSISENSNTNERRLDESSSVTSKLRSIGENGNVASRKLAVSVFNDDVIVDAGLCVGTRCTVDENLLFDTIRLKEDNLRIHFLDGSEQAGFPNNDWRIVINDSINGGENHFSIEDSNSGRSPFKVIAGARSNSLFVDSDGKVGFGTSTPEKRLHAKWGDTPTLRLEQDISKGYGLQAWYIAGNEKNFFIRDVTTDKLPFRIRPGAPKDSLYVHGNGNVGMGTESLENSRNLHIKENNGGTPGIRLDDGSQQWDIMIGNETSFVIGDVTNGINGTAMAPFQIESGAPTNSLHIQASGDVGIGTDNPYAMLHVAGDVKFDGLVNGINLTEVVTTDELQTLSLDLDGATLIVGENSKIDLAPIVELTLVDTTLSVGDNNQIDLAPVLGDVELVLDGTMLSTARGNTVDISPILDELMFDGTILSTTLGNGIDLSPILDHVELMLDGTLLSTTNGNAIDLSPILDDVALALDGTILSTTQGNTIDLAPIVPPVVLNYHAFIDSIGWISNPPPCRYWYCGRPEVTNPPAVVNYGFIGVTTGWTVIKASKLVGISVTPNQVIEQGSVGITVLVNLSGLVVGEYGPLTINPGEMNKVETFDEDIPAGSIVSVRVERIGEVAPYNNGAGVILQLEQ